MTTKSKKISFLPPERQQNIEIILGKLKISNSIIVDALLACNTDFLTENLLISLQNIAPSENEVSSVIAYDGELN